MATEKGGVPSRREGSAEMVHLAGLRCGQRVGVGDLRNGVLPEAWDPRAEPPPVSILLSHLHHPCLPHSSTSNSNIFC